MISVDGIASRTKVIANPTVLSAMSNQTLNTHLKTHMIFICTKFVSI